MTVSVTLTFPDVDAAITALSRIETPFGAPVAQVVEPKAETFATAPPPTTPYPAPVADEPQLAPVEQTTKRRGRPTKAGCLAATQAETVAAAPTAEPVIPKEAALAKFKALHDDKGMVVCRLVLTRLGAQRFADVKSGQYLNLVKLCDRAIGGEDLTKAIE